MTFPDYELATLTRRFSSKLLDWVFSFVALLVVVLLASLIHPLSETLGSIIVVFGYCFFYFYILFSDGFKGGQSYGKKAMGICVIDAKSGKQCTFRQSFNRNACSLTVMLVHYYWG